MEPSLNQRGREDDGAVAECAAEYRCLVASSRLSTKLQIKRFGTPAEPSGGFSHDDVALLQCFIIWGIDGVFSVLAPSSRESRQFTKKCLTQPESEREVRREKRHAGK